MSKYRSVEFEGKRYSITSDADFTGRLLTRKDYSQLEVGGEYKFEMRADALDEDGAECTVFWIFSETKGDEKELDEYEYDNVNLVEY